MAYDFRDFTLGDTIRCGTELRKLVQSAPTLEDAASGMSSFLFEAFKDAESGERSAALVRCYKTHAFSELPADLQSFARNVLKRKPTSPGVKCLTLLGTAGTRPEWNSRFRSIGHQAIPLESVEMVEQAPMVSQLIRQLGLDVSAVIAPTPEILRQIEGKSYGVFHVREAAGSPYIPAQGDFVIREGIRSVLGFGGMLRNGDMLATIIFSRVTIPDGTANRFRTMALDVRAALFSAGELPTFRAQAE